MTCFIFNFRKLDINFFPYKHNYFIIRIQYNIRYNIHKISVHAINIMRKNKVDCRYRREFAKIEVVRKKSNDIGVERFDIKPNISS